MSMQALPPELRHIIFELAVSTYDAEQRRTSKMQRVDGIFEFEALRCHFVTRQQRHAAWEQADRKMTRSGVHETDIDDFCSNSDAQWVSKFLRLVSKIDRPRRALFAIVHEAVNWLVNQSERSQTITSQAQVYEKLLYNVLHERLAQLKHSSVRWHFLARDAAESISETEIRLLAKIALSANGELDAAIVLKSVSFATSNPIFGSAFDALLQFKSSDKVAALLASDIPCIDYSTLWSLLIVIQRGDEHLINLLLDQHGAAFGQDERREALYLAAKSRPTSLLRRLCRRLSSGRRYQGRRRDDLQSLRRAVIYGAMHGGHISFAAESCQCWLLDYAILESIMFEAIDIDCLTVVLALLRLKTLELETFQIMIRAAQKGSLSVADHWLTDHGEVKDAHPWESFETLVHAFLTATRYCQTGTMAILMSNTYLGRYYGDSMFVSAGLQVAAFYGAEAAIELLGKLPGGLMDLPSDAGCEGCGPNYSPNPMMAALISGQHHVVDRLLDLGCERIDPEASCCAARFQSGEYPLAKNKGEPPIRRVLFDAERNKCVVFKAHDIPNIGKNDSANWITGVAQSFIDNVEVIDYVPSEVSSDTDDTDN